MLELYDKCSFQKKNGLKIMIAKSVLIVKNNLFLCSDGDIIVDFVEMCFVLNVWIIFFKVMKLIIKKRKS
jgi:hypothetical protein